METLSKPPQMLESGPEQELLPENVEGSERHIDVVDESETTTVEVTQGHGDDHEAIPTPANLELNSENPEEAKAILAELDRELGSTGIRSVVRNPIHRVSRTSNPTN